MASFQKTQDIDVLSVRKIYAKGESNRNLAPNSILATDGVGGTSWLSLSTINIGTSFNTISTSLSTFTASLGNTTFSILNSSNIGLIPASGNAVSLYSKSFGQIDVLGQNSINSFNSLTGTFSNSVELIGIGLAQFSTDTTRNKIYLLTPSTFLHIELSTFSTALGPTVRLPQMLTAFSSFSTVLGPTVQLPQMLTAFSTFSTALGPTVRLPEMLTAFSTFSTALGPTVQLPEMLTEFSTFSTALGPIVQVPDMISTFSTFSTTLGSTITFSTFFSTLSSFTSQRFYSDSISTSTISLSGIKQPVIQYGSSILANGSGSILLSRAYASPQYIIQLTYLKGAGNAVIPLSFSSVTSSNFSVYGDLTGRFHWTTYGNL